MPMPSDGIERDPRLVCDIIAERYGVLASEVHQTVAAAPLQDEFAKALGAAPQSPALEVIRRYLDLRGRLFEISESFHPGDRYAVTSVLRRVEVACGERGSGGRGGSCCARLRQDGLDLN